MKPAPPQAEKHEEPAAPPQKSIAKPAVESPPTADAGPKKAAVPSDAQQAEAEAKIRQIFKKEFTDAKSADGKLALAASLFGQGTNATDDLVARYVLWRLAARLAAEAVH